MYMLCIFVVVAACNKLKMFVRLRVDRMVSQCRVACLTDAYRLQNAQARDLRLETTAFAAEHKATIATMMFPFVQRESAKRFDNKWLVLEIRSLQI